MLPPTVTNRTIVFVGLERVALYLSYKNYSKLSRLFSLRQFCALVESDFKQLPTFVDAAS